VSEQVEVDGFTHEQIELELYEVPHVVEMEIVELGPLQLEQTVECEFQFEGLIDVVFREFLDEPLFLKRGNEDNVSHVAYAEDTVVFLVCVLVEHTFKWVVQQTHVT